MTRRNQRLAMERIYSRAPEGDEYPIEFAPAGPEDRGQIGRVRLRVQNGSGPQLHDLWWLRCPWCREMIELPRERINVEGGFLRIDGTVHCSHCESAYEIAAGVARRIPDVEGAGQVGVTSKPIGASNDQGDGARR